MKIVQVHELKERISEILDELQEKGETIEITNHGEVVALLVPMVKHQPPFERPEEDIWANMDRLATEISARWQGSTGAVDAVREVRREL